jgi:hypothetical protein
MIAWMPGTAGDALEILQESVQKPWFLKENDLELVEDTYHSIPMFNYQRFGIHGWRVWMPCPISVQFLTMFLDGSRPAM